MIDPKEVLEKAIPVVKSAGKEGVRFKGQIYTPEGRGIVTMADLFVQDRWLEFVKREFPNIPVISENFEDVRLLEPSKDHNFPDKDWGKADEVFVFDPYDGTRRLATGCPDYSNMFALMQRDENGELVPVVGIINFPETDICLYALLGGDVYRQVRENGPKIVETAINNNGKKLVIARSPHHRNADISKMIEEKGFSEITEGGIGGKAQLILEGRADAALTFYPIGVWDSAAPYRILDSAGYPVTDLSNETPRFDSERMKRGLVMSRLKKHGKLVELANSYKSN